MSLDVVTSPNKLLYTLLLCHHLLLLCSQEHIVNVYLDILKQFKSNAYLQKLCRYSKSIKCLILKRKNILQGSLYVVIEIHFYKHLKLKILTKFIKIT